MNNQTTSPSALYSITPNASGRYTLKQRVWQCLCIGIRQAPDALETRKVIQTNASALICFASMVFYNITFTLTGNTALMLSGWVQIPAALLTTGSVLLLNHDGKLLQARWALVLGVMADVSVTILSGQGGLIFTHGYFLVFAVYLPLYFNPNQWRSVVPAMLVNVGLFCYFQFNPYPIRTTMQDLSPGIVMMLQTCVMVCGVLLGGVTVLLNEFSCVRNQTLLQRMANTDSLTKLPNRRAFRDNLQRELARSARDRTPLALAMIDIDFFKRVNDERGHDVGDNVLQGVGQLISEQRRGIDMVARMGGEEFAVLMPDTTLDNARVLAERMRIAVAAFSFGPNSHPFKVHISIGLAAIGINTSEDNALKVADTALYRAKNEGRNRVVTQH